MTAASNIFSAKISDWVKNTKGAMENVFKQSVQDVIIEMQTTDDRGGNLPFDLGFLRSSLRITLNSPSSGLQKREGEEGSYKWSEEQAFTLTILGAGIEDSIYAVYLADYAMHQEYGTKYMPGKHFRDLAVQNWQTIVSRNAEKAKRMVG